LIDSSVLDPLDRVLNAFQRVHALNDALHVPVLVVVFFVVSPPKLADDFARSVVYEV
jgi:hypothetical protein